VAWACGETRGAAAASIGNQQKGGSTAGESRTETETWSRITRKLARSIREDALAAVLAAAAHPMRLRIVYLLLEGPATHRHLSKATDLKAGPLYHHVRELRQAGLLGPKSRDLYTLTKTGHRLALALAVVQKLLK
jgi:DNA-binding transcriptional ArsR family regulator